ncbi:MAG: succinate dehydrogenase/fumarate reductase iron-sulfur subunit [Deltaproteobacteria bacterium]|nr:succinate dehydrogenase/fumarate reductase iron-sulfur subunit [Deltaproteobacteria bacterium]
MRIILHVWRQKNAQSPGKFERYERPEVSPDMSFLEMLDVLNEDLVNKNEQPVVFDHDCREGICGACGFVVNGIAHGPEDGTTVCQLHMRKFKDGDELYLEPWRAKAFPLVRDLLVDRSALDRIIQAGGYITAPTGTSVDANNILVAKPDQERAMDAAACIGCGACVAACPNASAMLFTSAKVTHLGNLPQGQPERLDRVEAMVATMDKEGFGSCTLIGECSAACPKSISMDSIARLNGDYIRATFVKRPLELSGQGSG